MSEFAVGTQRANGNEKRVTSGKPALRDRDDRRRNCMLSRIVQSRETGSSRLRRRYRGLEFVSWTCGSSGNFGYQPHRFGRACKERHPQSIPLPKFNRHRQSSGAQYATELKPYATGPASGQQGNPAPFRRFAQRTVLAGDGYLQAHGQF